MTKKYGFVIYILFLLFLIPLCMAAQPPDQIFLGDSGLDIVNTLPKYVPISTAGNVAVFVFNSSNGEPLDSTNGISCQGILFDLNGSHSIEQTATPDGDHFRFSYTDTSMDSLGYYQYAFYCNTSKQGGYYASFFEVTPSGREENTGELLTTILYFAMIITYLFFIVKFFNVDMFAENGAIKMFFVLLCLWVMLIPYQIVYLYHNYYGLSEVATLLSSIWVYLIWLNFGVTFYFMIYFIIKLLRNMQNKYS